MMSRQKQRARKQLERDSDAQGDDPVWTSPKEYRDLIREIIEDLEHAGEIYDTGLRRNGQIVYAATPTLKK
jgi:hypothetical protein